MSNFFDRIDAFNAMYGLTIPPVPVYQGDARLEQFAKILQDEVDEQAEICPLVGDLEKLVSLADWLGDVIVYCASEARRNGIPIEQVLQIIMDSNASKLGADGQPIIADGKVQKGPNYWKPEPKIRELLAAQRGEKA